MCSICKGKIYFNTDLKLLKVCDGAAWTEIAARKPGTESHPGKDCLDLKESGIDLDGTYFVDFGTSDVFEVRTLPFFIHISTALLPPRIFLALLGVL